MFFQGNDAVHQTMKRVAERLEQSGIAYAIVGGMAVNAHHYSRTTVDVDFLLSSHGVEAFSKLLAAREFEPVAGHSRRFLDPATGVTFDFLIAGLFPGSGKPGPIPFPDPATVSEVIDQRRVINLLNLIQLKLAAGRHKDLGDVVELIRANDLDESYAQKLHQAVRADYTECLEEKRREDEYEKRQDQAFEDRRNQGQSTSGLES